MPYLLIAGPQFSFEQCKIMAAELTDAIMAALQYPPEFQDRITVHFEPYRSDQVAVGGRLLSELEEPNYYCQFMDVDLTAEKKKRLVTALFPPLLELLGLDPTQAPLIKLFFQDCSPEDIVIGGRFLTEISKTAVSRP